MLNKDNVQNIIDSISENLNNYATINITSSSQATTRFANSQISQNIAIDETIVELTVYDGKKEATCKTNSLTDEALKRLAIDTETLLKHVPDGEYEVFPFSREALREKEAECVLCKEFDDKNRAEIVKEGVSHIKKDFTASGALNINHNTIAVGNTEGKIRIAEYDQLNFNTVVTHKDGTAGAGECVSYTDAPDIVSLFKKAQSTAEAARKPIEPELGFNTVVLSPVAFADLISYVTRMLNAGAVEKGVSFAIGRLNKQIFGENLTIIDDVRTLGTRPVLFDYEGNIRTTLSLVEKGYVKSFLYDNKLAKKHGIINTGHAISNKGLGGYAMNIIVEPGNTCMDRIIQGVQKGVYINEFHYTNMVNARNLQVTGLTRNGTFLIENGEITKPISTVRFTVSLLDVFNTITALSTKREQIGGYMGSILTPGARIEKFIFTSKP